MAKTDKTSPHPRSMTPGPAPARDTRSVLRQRAALLAQAAVADETGASFDAVEFRLANERYAFEAIRVREVVPVNHLTPLPCTPPFILGIINVRGRIISVVDLKRFFDLPIQGLGDLNKVIILQAGEMELGIMADRVTGTRRLRLDELQPDLPTLTGIRGAYLIGIGPGQLVVLDAVKMLADKKLVIEEKVSA